MNIVVIGTGYVGLVTGTCFAEMGNNVVCIDINKEIVRNLSNGEIHIYENNLEKLVKNNIEAKRLSFTDVMGKEVGEADVIFIAVGTPQRKDGSANTDFVFKAAEDITQLLEGYTCIVVKSTVPVGTTDKIGKIINDRLESKNVTFDIVSNPEFLKEGVAIADFMKPDRIIIGCNNEKSLEVMKAIYSPFNRTHNKVLHMGVRDAELTKYVSNCMLATKISFINEMANIAEAVGANIENIRLGIGSDSRIGYDFIYPGCGYGGSCFPKDVSALIQIAEKNNIEPTLLKSVVLRNSEQKKVLFEKFKKHYNNELSHKVVTLWGIAFKPGTDDIREASSLILIDELVRQDIYINVHDPVALKNIKNYINIKYPEYDKINFFENQYSSLVDSDCLFIVTEWKNYRQPDFNLIYQNMNTPVIIDGRNIYINDVKSMIDFSYYSIGR